MVKNILNKGQSLFEVIVTLMIVSLVITAIAGLALLSVKSSTFSRNKTQATRYLQEANEWLRSEKDKDWTIFSGNAASHVAMCLPNLIWVGQVISCGTTHPIVGTTNLFRKVEFTIGTDVQAKVTVSWSDSGGVHEANSVTIFSNWQNK